MKVLALLVAAYLTLVCETVVAPTLAFQAPAACWAWLLLPWLAVVFPDGRGIVLAAIYGLSVDCLAIGILGPSVCLSVLATSVMQRLVSESSLRSALNVGIWTVCSCGLLASILSAIQMSVGVLDSSIQTIAMQITCCSLMAAVVVVTVTSLGRMFQSNDLTNLA